VAVRGTLVSVFSLFLAKGDARVWLWLQSSTTIHLTVIGIGLCPTKQSKTDLEVKISFLVACFIFCHFRGQIYVFVTAWIGEGNVEKTDTQTHRHTKRLYIKGWFGWFG
jgi:hypothetical protein